VTEVTAAARASSPDPATTYPPVRAEDLVFNVVYIPGTFRYLHPFLDSMLATSTVRARIVANGYAEADLAPMHRMAERHEGRVEVLHLSSETRVEHGTVLNELFDREEGEPYFCFLDTDVLSRGPWIDPFLDALTRSVAVSSAHPSWDADPRAPKGEMGLRGHFVYGTDGQLFGSSYLAAYRRPAVEEIRRRWGVDFRLAHHDQLAPATRARIEELDRHYLFYDTAKTINALLQLDGYRIEYLAETPLIHVGALSIVDYMVNTPQEEWPDPFGTIYVDDVVARDTVEVAANVAGVLMELVDGVGPRRLPSITDPRLEAWVEGITDDLARIVDAAGARAPRA
jgi:hypothetical protein